MCVPSGKIHFLYGVFLYIIAYKWLMFLPLIIGSMLPDCDIKQAPAAKFLPLYKLKCIKHRGITHTVWAILFVYALSFLFFGSTFALSLSVGYFVHLLLDATTPAGVKWFRRR